MMPFFAKSLSRPLAESALTRAWHWNMEGLRWWRRAPWILFVLCVIQLLVEELFQLIPWAGLALSKLIVPLLFMGILLGLDEMAQGRRLRLICLIACLCRGRFLPALGLATLWGFPVFGVQQLCVYLAYGWPAVDAVLLGHTMAHHQLVDLQFARLLLFPGVLPSTLLLLSPFLFLFRGSSPWQAICGSVQIVLSNAMPFAWLMLLNLSLFALMLSTSWTFALVLVLTPWSVATSYAVWRDVGKQTFAFHSAVTD